MAEFGEICKVELSSDKVQLSNDLITLTYDTQRGHFTLTSLDKKITYFSRAYFLVHTGRQVYSSRNMIFRRLDSIDLKTEQGPVKAVVLKLQSADKKSEIHVRLSLWRGLKGYTAVVQFKNKSKDPEVIHSIEPFVIDTENDLQIFTGTSESDLRVFKNGFHSWELTQAKTIEPGENTSHIFSVIHNISSRNSIALGFVTNEKQLTTISMLGSEDHPPAMIQVLASCAADNLPVDTQNSVMSEELLVLVGSNPVEMIREYAQITASKMKAVTWDNIPTGWCSWYFYYTMPDQYEIIQNADVLQKRFPQMQWVQLDDGYQRAVGDWVENDRFSNSLANLVEKIEARGFKAGIWTAPFIASKNSNLYRDKPHWFIRDRNNNPIPVGDNPLWYGEYYALDFTNPAVIQHIRNLFIRLKSYGFDYFKIDFLYHATQEGVRHDESQTRAQALRNGLVAIREAVGDSLILGCGAPLGQCIGITNMMRIGTDIATAWRTDWGGGVYECSINTMTRAFMHDTWWINDPDCILVRQDDNDLSLEEIRLWLTVVALSGGAILLSDRLEEVAEERLSLVDKLLPPYRRGAVAIDAFVEPEPRVFALKIATPLGEWAVVATLNLSEKEISVQFDLPSVGLHETVPHHVFEFWTQQYEGTVEESMKVTGLRPHTCRLFVIRPEMETPMILSTSIHFTQGAVELKDQKWDSAKNELSVFVTTDTRHEEAVFIVFGPHWRPKRGSINDEPIRLDKVAPEVIAIRRQFKAGQEITVTFDRRE
ncbi:MAG: alpha-galactosidase [Candidatus Thorarchaeota archaeon]|nr:alpha-galactosidase [Candidatus Thorarchaeota archaeon]